MNAFKKQSVTAKVDVTHLRVSATADRSARRRRCSAPSGRSTRRQSGANVALPVNTPKLPSGIKGNVDTVAGMRAAAHRRQLVGRRGRSAVDGGTPTRTGTPAFGCMPASFPSRCASGSGLYPNQILTAYGIAPLQAAGLQGQGARLAIVGEAPTPASDVNTFRSCFGTHGHVAEDPQRRQHQADPRELARRDGRPRWWRRSSRASTSGCTRSSESDDDGDVARLPRSCSPSRCRRRPTARRCRTSSRSPTASASRWSRPTPRRATLVERQLTATRRARHHHRRRGRRQRVVGVRARRPAVQAHLRRTRSRRSSWPATSPWVLAVGGTNLTLDAGNAIASTGAVERHRPTRRRSPRRRAAAAGRARSRSARGGSRRSRSRAPSNRMVPDVAAFADESPGYPIVCSKGVQGCTRLGPEHRLRRRHERRDAARRRA